MNTQGQVSASGEVAFKVFRDTSNFENRPTEKAPLSWRLKNSTRPNYIKGWLGAKALAPLARKFGVSTMRGELSIKVLRAHDGVVIDYGVVSRHVVTDAGVAFLVDDWDNNGQDLTTLNFHGIGTSSTAEAAGDTALGAESGTALNPDNTRATGTRSQPAANQYRSVGTLTADAQILAREHGLFSSATVGAGTLWDRSVYALITLEIGDSLQATYTCTINSGG